MKKITLLIALIAGFVGFSQSSRPAIQTYLDANRSKLELTAAERITILLYRLTYKRILP